LDGSAVKAGPDLTNALSQFCLSLLQSFQRLAQSFFQARPRRTLRQELGDLQTSQPFGQGPLALGAQTRDLLGKGQSEVATARKAATIRCRLRSLII
jgi:hypothetical protein